MIARHPYILLSWFVAIGGCWIVQATPTAADGLRSYKIERKGDCILLPVDVPPGRYPFLVHTGLSATVFDRSLLTGNQKGTRRIVGGVGPPRDVPVFETPQANFDNLDLKQILPEVVGLDLRPYRQLSGHPIYGVIGMDVLHSRILHIDFDKGELSFPNDVHSKGKAIDLSFDEGLPIAEVLFAGGIRRKAFITSGYISQDCGSVDASLYETLNRNNQGRVLGTTLIWNRSDIRLNLIRTDLIRLGEFETKQPVFGVGERTELGLHYWSRYIVTWDFPGRTMYLEPGKDFHRADEHDLSGLHIVRKESRTLIDSVDVESIAARANLRADDELVKIGGQDVSQLSLFQLRGLLCSKGAVIHLAGIRSGEEFEATLKLTD
jgi:hypothetical protein